MNLFEFGDSREVVIVRDGSRLKNFGVDGLKFHVEAAIGKRAEFFIKQFLKLPRVNQSPVKFLSEQKNFLAAQIHDLVKVGVEQELDIFISKHIFDEPRVTALGHCLKTVAEIFIVAAD